jgi:hypothetical protein
LRYLNKNAAVAGVTVFATGLSVLLLGIATWLAIEYRNTPLLGFYGFRETQTALTSYWACQEGFHLAYSTPVGGFPWSIPLEFPIYQWIVSLLGCSLHFQLDPVGRLVSYTFWIASLWPARIVCRRLFDDEARLYFWTFVALFLSAPIYLYYGRTFLPEAVGLFFSFCYLALSLEMWLGPNRWKDAILCGIFLTLAILQKSTTVLPLLLFAAVYLWMVRRELLNVRLRSAIVWKWVIAYVIPFAIGVIWVKYSDHVKMANAFGSFLTSSELIGWNFGTLAARHSEALWIGVIWYRVIGGNLAGHLGILLILSGFAFAPKRRLIIAAGVGLFLLFFMVFEHLLFLHEYYPFSNTAYLIFALAVATGGLVEAKPRLAPLWALAFAGVIAINLHAYFTGHLFAEEAQHFDDTHPVLATAKFVREHTSPEDPLLIYGDLWNSQLPYYGQRKAFVVPTFFKPYLAPLDTPEKYLERVPGAILVCGDARTDKEVMGKVVANYPTWTKASLIMCDIYLRKS